MPRRAGWLGGWLALLGLIALAPALPAQVPLDSVPSDTVRDTVYTTQHYLEAQAANKVRLPVLPTVGLHGPFPPTTRIVLTSDSIDWALAETVSDLLQRVPGVYLWRGGWVGRTEYPDYRGRGPASVEYFVDGLPYIPIGPDSLGIDPSFFSLSLFDRIEIERFPASLRVYLYTRRHAVEAPGSRVGIASGDKQIARYIGALERRYRSGIGFALAGERMVAPTATGTSSDFDITNIWLQLGYVPSRHFGVQAQLLTSNPDRKPFVEQSDTLDLRLTGKRSDAQLRLFWKPGGDSSGFRVDGLFGRTRWNGTGVKDEVRQGGIIAGWRSPTFGVSATAFNRSRWTPWDLSAEAGWAPTRALSASVEAGYQTHDRNRSSRWAAVRGGVQLPLGLALSGTLRTGRVVPIPALLATPAQSLSDWQATASWNRPWAGVELGYGHAAAFTPQAYRSFRPTVDSLAPAPAADWVTVGWRLTPKSWLTLQGWYSNPRGGSTPDGVPPTHSMTSLTLRSKFWRTFRSGIYDFKAQVAYETWGNGVIGRDATGLAIPLDGASFWRTAIEIRLDRFLLYWDRYNLQASRKTYVPGFRLLNFGSTFGVRWEFLN